MNTPPHTFLGCLRAWPDLWRRPAVFALIHGAAETPPSRSALLSALLEVEPTDLPEEAWDAIVQREDMAAVQAAYEELSPRISADRLSEARKGFERRAAKVRARAFPLSGTLRNAVSRSLDEAIAIVAVNPAEAERFLARADAQAHEAEAQGLAALQRIFAADTAGDGGSPKGARLRAALEAGDLRLARIVAGQLGVADSALLSASSTDDLLHDPWIDRQSTIDILNWSRDPTLAPAGRLPIAELVEHDLALLAELAEALETGAEVSQAGAEHMLRLVIRSLTGGSAPDLDITPLPETSADIWSFNVSGAPASRLFPHAADEHGAVIIVPRRPVLRFPSGPSGRRFVAFDPYERWTVLAKPDSILMTPRMVVRALLAANEARDTSIRCRSFVRLQSAAIAVRPLILNVLARDEARCRRLIDATSSSVLSTEELQSLAQALDIYVDDGDLTALRDACGDRFTLLLEVLHILAEELEGAQVAHRRFDCLRALLRPEVEERVAALIETDLRRRLAGEQRTDTALILGDAMALLEDHSAGSGASLTVTKLVEGLLAAGSVSTAEEGRNRIAELLSLGLLLTSATDLNDTAGSACILRILPLPGRILLKMDD